MTEDGSVCSDWDFHEYEYAELVTADGGLSYSATATVYVTWGASYASSFAPCEITYDVTVTPDGASATKATLEYTETSNSCPSWLYPDYHSGPVEWSISGSDVTWTDAGIGYASADGTITALWNWGCISAG